MHIADWNPEFMSRFDPEKYAEAVSASGVDTAIIYSGSCLGICYWPTRAGHMHEGLKGRDIFGETVEACKRRGLRVVAYYNIWNRWEFDHHPQWRMRDIEGRAPQVEYGERFGLCCPNTGYKDFVRQQIEDLCSHYSFDGLWIDMIGWFGTVCYCDDCRRVYREQTGKELPEKVDFADPNWVRFIRKRQEWQADFAQMINDTARAAQPGISVTHQVTSFLNGWPGGASMAFLDKCDYLAGDFYLGPAPEAFVCKFLRAASRSQPIEFMVSRCIDLYEHTTTKSVDLLTMQMFMAVSHLSAFVFIDAIDPAGTVNRELYDTMHSVLSRMDPFLEYMHPASRQMADVAIYFNPDNVTSELTVDTSFSGANRFPQLQYAYAVAKTLIDANIPFDVVTPRNRDSLSDHAVVILSECQMLDQAETDCLRAYVREGGKLYVSGKTGLVDGCGKPWGDFALADVLGVHDAGETEWDTTYMTPAPSGKDAFAGYRPGCPLCLTRRQAVIRADDDAEILATRSMPYNDPHDNQRFAAAISNPPGEDTDEPCVTLHPYGKGQAMYAAGVLEAVEYDAQRAVFARLLQQLMGGPFSVQTNAPKPVQINVFRQPEGRMVLNLLNFQQELPAVPVHDLWVTITLEANERVTAAYYAKDRTPCAFEQIGNRVTCRVPRLDIFEMIVLETA